MPKKLIIPRHKRNLYHKRRLLHVRLYRKTGILILFLFIVRGLPLNLPGINTPPPPINKTWRLWPSYLIYVLQYVLLKRFATWDVKLNLVKWYGFIFPREIDYHNFKFASPKKKLYATLDNDNIIIYWAIYHFKGLLLATFKELKNPFQEDLNFWGKKNFFGGKTHTKKKNYFTKTIGTP